MATKADIGAIISLHWAGFSKVYNFKKTWAGRGFVSGVPSLPTDGTVRGHNSVMFSQRACGQLSKFSKIHMAT